MDTLRLYFVTWNVATRNPGQDLNSLLDFPSQYNKSKPLADFYVIGLQEVKSQPQNLLLDSLFSDPWTSSFNKILCRHDYVVAKTIRLQGLLLLVYVQKKHIIHLRDIEAQYTKTGLGGYWGNKGAVSVRFNIYGCSVCFVNCHLTAHEHLLADRVSDYNTIIKEHTYHIHETANILYHDYVFWIGDFNFRTDYPSGSSPSSVEIVSALQKIEKDKYTNLLQHDQLKAVMETGEAFSEFSEPEIKFPPTYKFFVGRDDYDIKRKPSWTDRVLYKVIKDNYENVTLKADMVSYTHIPQYTVSDHKPVIAQYTIKIRPPPPRRRWPSFYSSLRAAPATMETVTSTFRAAPSTFRAANGHNDKPIGDHDVLDSCQDEEVFSNYTEKTVEFAPIGRIWYIGEMDFRTHCTLSPDVEINPNDWIGIFDADFQNLDDYTAYEYLAKVQVPQTPGSPDDPRTITLSFPVGSGVRTPGFYRFIYFSQPNNDVRSVLGISEPFEVSYKDDAMRLINIDPCVQPTGREGQRMNKPSTASTDVFSDFSGLDVANLSRHFSHDLSID